MCVGLLGDPRALRSISTLSAAGAYRDNETPENPRKGQTTLRASDGFFQALAGAAGRGERGSKTLNRHEPSS